MKNSTTQKEKEWIAEQEKNYKILNPPLSEERIARNRELLKKMREELEAKHVISKQSRHYDL